MDLWVVLRSLWKVRIHYMIVRAYFSERMLRQMANRPRMAFDEIWVCILHKTGNTRADIRS